MVRMSGTVKAKKVLASGPLKTLPELKPESRPHGFPRLTTTKQPKRNQSAARTQVHFAAELRNVLHMKNPRKAAQTMLKMISFHTIAATV
jgi:hypothetical protein